MSNLAICALPDSSLQDAHVILCPPWCDPKLCEVTSTDRLHVSHPAHWHTRDAVIDLNLTRADEFAFDCPGDAELALSL